MHFEILKKTFTFDKEFLIKTNMNNRNIERNTAFHITFLACMVLAWGVASFYYNSHSSSQIIGLLGNLLLYPAFFVNKFLYPLFSVTLTASPMLMFLTLWLSYSLVALWFAPVFIVKSHKESDLLEWYQSRC